MKNKGRETKQKLQEDEEDREMQREIKQSVKKWARATCFLGLAFVISAGAWFLFFPGQALHPLWQTWGRLLAVTTLCLGLPWIYAAATTVNLWLYGADLRKIYRDFASGKSGKWR
jgi:cation transport ATPase